MSQPFLGEIRMFGGNFAPRGWAFCDGSLLSISNYEALFTLIGTTYGGDGQSTFGLPNLQGRAPMHPGNGAGLSPRVIGETGGTATVTLSPGQIPGHNHTALGSSANVTVNSPRGAVVAQLSGRGANLYNSSGTPVPLQSLTSNAGSQPHNNMQPYLVINFIIALEGIFPSKG